MRISIHLTFDGDCAAAFKLYQKLLGGELTTMMEFGDSPLADTVEPRFRDRILHATLKLGDQELLGADVLPRDYARPQGFSILLSQPTLADAKRVFDAFADGGRVHMPFQKVFWADGFGIVVDRFGVSWEVTC